MYGMGAGGPAVAIIPFSRPQCPAAIVSKPLLKTMGPIHQSRQLQTIADRDWVKDPLATMRLGVDTIR